MNTALMARKPKSDPRTVAIAKAILKQYDCKNVEDMQDAIKDIFGPMFEAMLPGEMDSHSGYESNDHGPKSTKNRRNGYNSKTLKSTYGDITVEVPCDRDASFELRVIPKRTRDVSGIEDKILSMYARGIPCGPGQPEKVDSVYVRNGVADVFMISEPLAGRRKTVVTQPRTALDFAEVLRYASDTLYPRAEKIVLVTDNLNTYSPASLYKAFPPQEAHRLAEHFEWHYTPKHGRWLDMAEIEIGIMSRLVQGKPLPDLESFKQQVRAWTIRRNAECAKINWHFKMQDAWIKLAGLYPVIVYYETQPSG